MKKVLWLMLIVVFVACGREEPPTAQPVTPVPPSIPITQQQTLEEGVVVSLTADTAPVINTQQAWIVNVQMNGKPIDGADVYIELDMPAMPMGQNKPIAVAQGEGNYKAEGTYTMGGVWHLIVHVNINGKEFTAKFDVKVPE